MKTLDTWRGKSEFSYSGTVKDGTVIQYGSGHQIPVSSSEYQQLLDHFHGLEVDMGTSRDTPQKGSVGEWLQLNVTKTAIASYVGPILIEEGYAVKGGISSRIRFK